MDVLAEFVLMMSAASVEAGVMALILPAIVVTMHMFQTDAVLLFARTIVEGMEQIVLDKKGKRTEDGAAVYGRQQPFDVSHGEGIVEVLERLPDHNAHGCRPHVMVLQMLSYFVVHGLGVMVWGLWVMGYRLRFLSILMTIQGA